VTLVETDRHSHYGVAPFIQRSGIVSPRAFMVGLIQHAQAPNSHLRVDAAFVALAAGMVFSMLIANNAAAKFDHPRWIAVFAK
jgi:hypothetical protein